MVATIQGDKEITRQGPLSVSSHFSGPGGETLRTRFGGGGMLGGVLCRGLGGGKAGGEEAGRGQPEVGGVMAEEKECVGWQEREPKSPPK